MPRMKRLYLITIPLILLAPLLVFVSSSLNAGYSLSDTLGFMLEHCTTKKRNLLIIGALGFIPLALQVLILFVSKKVMKNKFISNNEMGVSHLLLFSIIVWSNLEFWPKYFIALKYPGFPHGLELFLGPVVFGSIAIAASSLLFLLIGPRDNSL